MLKKIVIALGAVVALLIVVVATRRAEYTVSRSKTVTAPPEVVFALVDDFHRWAEWSPWDHRDPAMKKTFEGPASGTGAVYAWAGNHDVGEGRMRIVGVEPNAKVEIELAFLKPFPSTSRTIFTFERAGGSTNVVWTMKATRDFMGKAFSLVMDMDKLIGPDFEAGLSALAKDAESDAKKRAEQARGAAPAAPPPDAK